MCTNEPPPAAANNGKQWDKQIKHYVLSLMELLASHRRD